MDARGWASTSGIALGMVAFALATPPEASAQLLGRLLNKEGRDEAAHAPQLSWADALFAEHGHDFGPVPRGAVVRHMFVLKNTTGEALTILDVRASCGCTTGRALTTTIEPGKDGYIEAQMDTRNFAGLKATVLTVTMVTASGRQAEARLDVRSNILADIVLNPGTVELGVVSRGQPFEQVLTIDRHGAPQWRAERMAATRRLSNVIDAQLQEVGRSAQGVSYRLTVRLKPDAPAGAVREEIRIMTNDPESPVVPVLVTGEVRGALAASPTLLALGRASSSGPVQGRYLVRGMQPFSITKIEGAGDGFSIEAAEPQARKALHVVTVSFAPGQNPTAGDHARAFHVFTDLPGEPPLTLQATARVEP